MFRNNKIKINRFFSNISYVIKNFIIYYETLLFIVYFIWKFCELLKKILFHLTGCARDPGVKWLAKMHEENWPFFWESSVPFIITLPAGNK